MQLSLVHRRTIVIWILALALAVPALADQAVIGSWDATVESRRGTNEIQMVFAATEEGLKGTWIGPRGEFPLEDVTYVDGKLTFVRHLEVQGREIRLDYEATVDGDTMQVTMKTPRGERTFTADRAEG